MLNILKYFAKEFIEIAKKTNMNVYFDLSKKTNFHNIKLIISKDLNGYRTLNLTKNIKLFVKTELPFCLHIMNLSAGL